MANYISSELARGVAKVPAYTPFIAPDVATAPWAVTAKEHVAAVFRRRGNSRQHKKGGNSTDIPIQAWLLYQLRFLVAADLAGAWSGFGGSAAQLSHLAIVMDISIVERASVALSYDRLSREFLAERDRPRREIAGPAFFSDFFTVGNPALMLKALAENPRAAQTPNDQATKAELLKQKKETAAAAKAAAAANAADYAAREKKGGSAPLGASVNLSAMIGIGAASSAPGRAPGVVLGPRGRLHLRRGRWKTLTLLDIGPPFPRK